MSVFTECLEAGLNIDYHESDLYIEDSEKAKEILTKNKRIDFTRFYSRLDKKWWLDVPFAYDPFWEKK
jgi:hypothetical protein